MSAGPTHADALAYSPIVRGAADLFFVARFSTGTDTAAVASAIAAVPIDFASPPAGKVAGHVPDGAVQQGTARAEPDRLRRLAAGHARDALRCPTRIAGLLH